jgi:hypothetical protein
VLPTINCDLRDLTPPRPVRGVTNAFRGRLGVPRSAGPPHEDPLRASHDVYQQGNRPAVMLYEFYDGYADALASIRLVARAANALLNQPFPLSGITR